jgi:hypothetical protein
LKEKKKKKKRKKMGLCKSKSKKNLIIKRNKLYSQNKYEKAYVMLGERLYTIPIKYIVNILNEEKWKIDEIVNVLEYIDYVEECNERKEEIKNYIKCLEIQKTLKRIKVYN